MGWEMYHGPRLWSKNCAVRGTEKYCKKTAQQNAKRAAHSSRESGGGWLGWGTYISFAMWVGGSEDTWKGYSREVKSRQYRKEVTTRQVRTTQHNATEFLCC